MPTYEYRCKSCGHAMEIFQPITDNPKRKCPACAKMALERLIGTGGAVLFKGSGFYQTDYRSASYKKGAKADSGASNGSPSTDSASPAKPDSCACGKAGKSQCAGTASGAGSGGDKG